MGYVRLKPRRWPAKQKNEKELNRLRNNFKLDIVFLRKISNVVFWFCDEAGFEGDPQPRQIIAHRGEKPLVRYFGGHIRTSLVGAVRVEDGKFVSLIVPYTDTMIFQCFADELNRHVNKRQHNIIVFDNASWHKNIDFGRLIPKKLPPYSPFLNPIEELWLAIKKEFFSWFCTQNHDNLDDQIEKAVRYFIERKELVRSICSMRTFG